jgi:glucosamine-phosphate N-acetyltransferase
MLPPLAINAVTAGAVLYATLHILARRKRTPCCKTLYLDSDKSYALRRIRRSDLGEELLGLLSQLTIVGTPSHGDLNRQLDKIWSTGNQHIMIVEECQSRRIVGAGSLLMEHKFIHGCSNVGHLEDVVIASTHRGRRLGQLLIQNLVRLAQEMGCYKVILDCADGKVPFYEECGFSRKGQEMALYFRDTAV